MKNFLAGLIFGILISFLTIFFWWKFFKTPNIVSPINQQVKKELPLLKYTFENLKKREYKSEITFEKQTRVEKKFSVWQVFFDSDGLKVSALSYLPNSVATSSAFLNKTIVMNRGFATQEEYFPGFGTQRVAEVLATNGFTVVAPDFLGFGESQNPSTDVFEERFQTYTTVLNLLAGIEKQCGGSAVHSPQSAPEKKSICSIGLWGHSNGGQITLSILAITGKEYPAVLWNPVSKPFPYSILYYTDGFDDLGKALRKEVARFEKDYDVDQFNVTNYFSDINAPILLQQGGADDLVPQSWSEELNSKLKNLNKDIKFVLYPGADHSLVPKWNEAVSELLRFYSEKL